MAIGLVLLIAGCAKQASPDPSPDRPSAPPPRAEPKDPPPKEPAMPDPNAPIHMAPPPIDKPAEDTARYAAWMAKRGTAIKDTPREDTNLRIADWGFFDHGSGPGEFADRAGLDRAGHVIVPAEAGDWHAFFTAPGVDATIALSRVTWLWKASGLEPSPRQPKVTAPTLTTGKDGTVTFQGWMVFPPAGNPIRMTITATAGGAKLVQDSVK
jgi:hypothetical protein